MKIVTIVGARPQFIKAAVLSRVLKKDLPGISEILVHTGQHFDGNMSDVFFRELGSPEPDYNLGVIETTHGRMTGKMLGATEDVLIQEKPDCAVVYGDTNTTLAGSLAAAKLHIPVAHVEAGLRSFNRRMPEEVNRVLCDHLSSFLFCPTSTAVENLEKEGITSGVHLVGDVMYDAALYYAGLSETKSTALQDFGLQTNGYILVTIHRVENTDDPERLRTIFKGLCLLSGEMPVIVPLHPRTRAKLIEYNLYDEVLKSLTFTGPLGYLDMVALEKNAQVVVTDSGGVQKEAYFHGTPCVTLREETEWVELVESGWNFLCPPRSGKQIQNAVLDIVRAKDISNRLYGDGAAGEKIARTLVESFC